MPKIYAACFATLIIIAGVVRADSYTVPTDPRTVVDEDPAWRFADNPAGNPQSNSYDDSASPWVPVNLPYTDGKQGSDQWYRKTITVGANLIGNELYLQFEGSYLSTSLYIDGAQVDYNPVASGINGHDGGFQTFVFDVTSQLTAGDHLIAVQVASSNNKSIAPASGGDYNRQGGIYRDVSLVAVNKSHIALSETVSHTGLTVADTTTPIASQGVFFSNSNVAIGSASATLTIKSVLDNLTAGAKVNVTSYMVDAAGTIQSQATTAVTLETSQTGVVVTQTPTIRNPHLWDGRIDPYRYDLYVEVRNASNVLIDLVHQKVGIRSFRTNANPVPNGSESNNTAPFMLNGHAYTLLGADMHQDSGLPGQLGGPVGWAQSDAQIRASIDMLADMGGTVIRTSHYQDNQAFYDYCDQIGIMVYTENSINGNIPSSTSVSNYNPFLKNTEDQYNELIKQNYNHPSVFAWGFGNETSDSPVLRNIFAQLRSIAHTLDPNRKTSFANFGGANSSSNNADGIPDIKGTHNYDYWYGPQGLITAAHHAFPNQPLGITEFGGGGSAYQYTDNKISLPVNSQPGGVKMRYHPANQQVLIEETYYTEIAPLNFLWGKVIWQMFDHPDGKTEGDRNSQNDKGMATRERIPKDSYYFYKATWNDPKRNYANNKVIYISDHNWTARNNPSTTVTVFSNIGAPTLFLNGNSLGTMTPLVVQGIDENNGNSASLTVANAYVMSVTLPVGNNLLEARRVYSGDGQTYSNSVNWKYYNATSFGKSTPFATGVAVNRTFTFDPASQTTSNPFEITVPNGTYDVRINAAAGSSTSNMDVNNLSLEGQTAAIDSNGGTTADTFYARVVVSDGKLTLAAAPGAWNATVTTIDISTVNSTP